MNTVTGIVPPCASRLELTSAVSCVLLTTVVVRLVPPNRTTELPPLPLMKLVPLTVNVKADPLATVDWGESEVTVGTGLLIGKLTALDVPPPGAGSNTVTKAAPAWAINAAGIMAVNCV